MQGTVDERLAAAGGVNDSLVEAFRSLLNGEHLQGLVVPCVEVVWRLCALPETSRLCLGAAGAVIARQPAVHPVRPAFTSCLPLGTRTP